MSSGGRAEPDDLRAFADATGATFPILVDTDDTYAAYTRDPSSAPFPLDVVVDADGTIVYVGGTYDPEALRVAVESVLP